MKTYQDFIKENEKKRQKDKQMQELISIEKYKSFVDDYDKISRRINIFARAFIGLKSHHLFKLEDFLYGRNSIMVNYTSDNSYGEETKYFIRFPPEWLALSLDEAVSNFEKQEENR